MPKTHATGRERDSEQKRDAQQADNKAHIGGQGMGQGRGMNPGEVQTPPNKPGQFEDGRVEKPKGRATKSGRLKLPPQNP